MSGFGFRVAGFGVRASRGGVFTPSDLTELDFWLDVDSGISLTGNFVNNWESVNDVAIDFTQSGDGAVQNPLKTGQKILDADAIRWDGHTMFLRETAYDPGIGTNAFYIAFVAQFDAVTSFIDIFGIDAGDPDGINLRDATSPAITSLRFQAGATNSFFPSNQPSPNVPYVIEIWRDGSDDMFCRINDIIDTDAQNNTGILNGSTQWNLGSKDENTNFFQGYFGDWILCNSLPSEADRNKARDYLANQFGITLFDPGAITDLICWMDPRSGITLNGNDISDWEARNDAAIDFTQATAGQQPLYIGAEINAINAQEGRQAIDFESSSTDRMDTASVTHNVGTGDFYIAVACQAESAGYGQPFEFAGGGDAVIWFYDANDTLAINGGGALNDTFAGLPFKPLERGIIVELWRDSGTDYAMVNGLLSDGGHADTFDYGTAGVLTLEFWDGELGDIIFVSSLPSAADRKNIREYMGGKYGIETIVPTDVTGLFFWMEPKQNITLNASDISNWEAMNDAGFDFTQATAAEQPLYNAIVIGGQQAIDFDGTNHHMQTATSENPAVGTGDYYLAVVVEFDTLGSGDTVFCDDNGNLYELNINASSQINISHSATDIAFPSIVPEANKPYFLEQWRDGTSVRCRLNGVPDSDTKTSSATTLNSDTYNIGARTTTPADLFDGTIGDFMLFNSLPTVRERDRLMNKYTQKYGITLWTPEELTNLVFWMDPNQNLDFENVNWTVSGWQAVNDVAIDFVNATQAAQPLYHGQLIGTGQALDFDGTNDELTETSITHSIGTGTFYTCFVVRADSAADNKSPWSWSTGDHGPYFDLGDWHFGFSGGTNPRFNSIVPATGTDYVMEFWRDGSNNVRCRQNGVIDSDSRTNTTTLGTTDQFWIAETNFGGDNWDGEIGDIVLVQALPSLAERNLCAAYMADKYGITIVL